MCHVAIAPDEDADGFAQLYSTGQIEYILGDGVGKQRRLAFNLLR
jgi:hypothetical protein